MPSIKSPQQTVANAEPNLFIRCCHSLLQRGILVEVDPPDEVIDQAAQSIAGQIDDMVVKEVITNAASPAVVSR